MRQRTYSTSFVLRVQRRLLGVTFGWLFHLLGRIRYTGLANVPRGTAYMVVVNHVSIYDPPLLLATWPETIEAIGAEDVFHKPVQGPMLKLYGTIPVHRGQYDRELMDTTVAILRSGRALLIAPEGGRSHSPGMRRAKPGIAYVAEEAQVPVVPVGIVGTTDDFLRRALQFRRPLLEVRIGVPFRLPPISGRGEARRASRQHNADLVMQHIAGPCLLSIAASMRSQRSAPSKPISSIWRPELTHLPKLHWRRRQFRRLVRSLARAIIGLLTDTAINGTEHLPPAGPAILTMNHLGDADTAIIQAGLPRAPEVLGKIELLSEFPVLGTLMDWYGTIWLHRGQPDRRALGCAL